MQTFSPTQIKEIMARHGAQTQKLLGQNFLIDSGILSKIILAANLKKEDTVLEVGPGMGVLTRALAENAGRVIAIEKDRGMLPILEETIKGFKNVDIFQGDILKVLDSGLSVISELENYKVVANIPYYLTSALIRAFLESKNQPSEIVLMIQKEVARRIVAKPPEMSLLAVSVQFYAKAEIISYVSKNCFWPSPKIDSAIIKITPSPRPCPLDPKIFFKIAKAGFSHPRKQLINNFCTALLIDREQAEAWLTKNSIQPNQRAETLSLQDWINLAKDFDF